jgi:flagellar biosynthesis protein FliR
LAAFLRFFNLLSNRRLPIQVRVTSQVMPAPVITSISLAPVPARCRSSLACFRPRTWGAGWKNNSE